MPHRYATSRAFSLIESLVVIGVVGLVISITLPVLAGARRSTDSIISLANLRSLGQSFELSVESDGGYYPIPHRRNGQWGPLIWEPPSNPTAVLHYYGDVWWHGRFFWPALLHDVAPWPDHYSTWLSPGRDVPDGDEPLWVRASMVSYDIATCFYASPSIWTPGAAATDAMIGRLNVSAVAFPSAKVHAYDRDGLYSLSRGASSVRPVLFADGSAAVRGDSLASPPTPNPLNGGRAFLYHDTMHGAAGRDF